MKVADEVSDLYKKQGRLTRRPWMAGAVGGVSSVLEPGVLKLGKYNPRIGQIRFSEENATGQNV